VTFLKRLLLVVGRSSIGTSIGLRRKWPTPDAKGLLLSGTALGLDGNEVWKQAFTARLERWLKKEGFKGPSSELLANFFESLIKRE
jgi:hypothetical protein